MDEDQIAAAAIKMISGNIMKGDLLKYNGHTSDFTEIVDRMEINNQIVEEAKTGDLDGVKVKKRVRKNDKVYKVLEHP